MSNKKQFETFLVVEKGLQNVTVKGYSDCIDRVAKVIGRYPDVEKVRGYIFVLYTSDYSYSHKTNTALAIERYMEFLGTPIQLGRQKKPKVIIKETLTEGEITGMIISTKNIREKAILSLLAYSGVRNMELCNLKVKDIHFSENIITVIRGKGLKDGISEIPPICTKVISEYLTVFPRIQNDFLFTTLRYKHHLNTRDIRKLVKTVSRRAKVTKRVYPHLFRHSMAANMLMRGANLITLKNQLRHTLLETTLHYINSIIFVEKNNYQKFVPSYL